MKLTSVKYLAGNGLKNIWLNKLMSVASIGVLVACMSVIGLAVAVSLNVDHALSDLEQQNVVMAYFNDRNSALYSNSKPGDGTASEGTYNEITEDDYLVHSYEDALKICHEISLMDNVLSVEYVSSEAGLESIKDSMLGEDAEYFSFLENDEYGNPLPSGAKITMKDLSLFDETLEKIKTVKGVDATQSSQDVAEKITTLKQAIYIIGFWIVAILMIISIVIVSNTIRVTMYNRKLEISIMKAVGATDSFVRLPFMIEGVTLGLVSATVTVVILYFVYNAVKETVKNALSLTTIIPFSEFFWLLFGIFAGIGCFAGLFSSAFMINKYLRKEGSEFRAL
jgi:cell division transport system permease protein